MVEGTAKRLHSAGGAAKPQLELARVSGSPRAKEQACCNAPSESKAQQPKRGQIRLLPSQKRKPAGGLLSSPPSMPCF